MPITSNRSKKLQRTTAQRGALIRSLTIALIENRSIETTLPKAKALRPYAEKLITKAKIGDLHNRRLIIARLHSIESASILIDEIAPALKDRNTGGYLRIKHSGLRRGDNAQMAVISFVDDTTKKPEVKNDKAESKKAEKPAKPTAKKSAPKTKKAEEK
jgi:large subunit ribosomal protein L17